MRRYVVMTAGATLLLMAPLGSAAEKDKSKAKAPAAPQEDVNELSLETSALGMLRRLQATPVQMRAMARLASPPAKDSREKGKASAAYVKALTELRTALVKGDEKQIDELEDKIEELQKKESSDLDDGVEVTDGARENAPTIVDVLSARQVMHYLSERENVSDPVELLLKVVEVGRKQSGEAWQTLRDEAAEDVAGLFEGVREKKVQEAVKKITAALEAARKRKADDASTRKDLEQLIGRLKGKQSAFDLLKNVVERDVAELLSNPRLSAAVKARLASK